MITYKEFSITRTLETVYRRVCTMVSVRQKHLNTHKQIVNWVRVFMRATSSSVITFNLFAAHMQELAASSPSRYSKKDLMLW
jgi:hypothetical protein